MTNITTELIKKLREKTQVGMMECKKALILADGDVEKAIVILRKKGAEVAAKRAGKETRHGRIQSFISEDNKTGSLVEISCETDFSANTDDMKKFITDIAKTLVQEYEISESKNDISSLLKQKLAEQEITIEQALNDLIAKIGENIKLNKFVRFDASDNGFISSYIHHGANIGILIHIETDKEIKSEQKDIFNLAKEICMQIAVTNPITISSKDLDPQILAKEKEIMTEQLKQKGKPENIIEKILIGKVNKYYKEVCLLHQKFIKNDKIAIQQHIDDIAKKIDLKIQIKEFQRFEVGE